MTIETIGTPGLWLGFTGFVLVLLAPDFAFSTARCTKSVCGKPSAGALCGLD